MTRLEALGSRWFYRMPDPVMWFSCSFGDLYFAWDGVAASVKRVFDGFSASLEPLVYVVLAVS